MAAIQVRAEDLVEMFQGIIAAQSAAHLMIVKSLVDAGALDGPGVLDAMERMAAGPDGPATDILRFQADNFRAYLEDTTPPEPFTLQVIEGGKSD